MPRNNLENDWIIENGFYIAKREFLERRGYCCGNQCRNCPYINWKNDPAWIGTQSIVPAHVATRVIDAIQEWIHYHITQLVQSNDTQREYHQEQIAHYKGLLYAWNSN